MCKGQHYKTLLQAERSLDLGHTHLSGQVYVISLPSTVILIPWSKLMNSKRTCQRHLELKLPGISYYWAFLLLSIDTSELEIKFSVPVLVCLWKNFTFGRVKTIQFEEEIGGKLFSQPFINIFSLRLFKTFMLLRERTLKGVGRFHAILCIRNLQRD